MVFTEVTFDGSRHPMVIGDTEKFVDAAMDGSLTAIGLGAFDKQLRDSEFKRSLNIIFGVSVKQVQQEHRWRGVEFQIEYRNGPMVYYITVSGSYNVSNEVGFEPTKENLKGLTLGSDREVTELTKVTLKDFTTHKFSVTSEYQSPQTISN